MIQITQNRNRANRPQLLKAILLRSERKDTVASRKLFGYPKTDVSAANNQD
jgi:hypothetical protein